MSEILVAVSEDSGDGGAFARWDPYVLAQDLSLVEQWRQRAPRCDNVLIILGHGFDPRMCAGLEMLKNAGLLAKTRILVLDYRSGVQPANQAVVELIERNAIQLVAFESDARSHDRASVRLTADDGRRIGARSAASIIADLQDLSAYSDVVVDVSALPRTLYFPLIGALLQAGDSAAAGNRRYPNIHTIVAESSALDSRIVEEGVEPRADYLPGFTGGLDQEAFGRLPTLWIPLLGERQHAQLSRIYDLVVPDEICPVLPSPSVHPRRADNLVLEYRDLLFDRLRLDPKNVLYAAEQNPFEVYRQLRTTVLHYEDALAPLGGCKTAISVLSSKLMSVGALLTAYEMKTQGHHVGIAHVEANRYTPDDDLTVTTQLDGVHVFGLWLAGDCYAR